MKELRVRPIMNGTVIDHITPGQALNVLKILGIHPGSSYLVTMAMNVPSNKYGKKDILKIEDRELTPGEIQKIAIIAPNATINIIRDYKVISKQKPMLPELLEGVVRCPNSNCISNTKEPLIPRLVRDSGGFRCYYCERIAKLEELKLD